MKRSPDAAVITQREIQFLLAVADDVAESPTEFPRPTHIAQGLGLNYDEAIQLVNGLHRRKFVHRNGSDQVLSDMRVVITFEGLRALLRHGGDGRVPAEAERDLHELSPPSSGLRPEHLFS